jgi:malate dehydrogenase
MESGPIEGYDALINGTNRHDAGVDAASSPPVGRASWHEPRRFLATNSKIITAVGEGIKKHAPQSFVIVVSNPLDAMVTLMKRVTGFPKQRVVGMAGVLDSSRYRTFVAMELGVSVQSVAALVLGGHGDDMVPVRSYCSVGGVPIERLIKPDRLNAIEDRTRKAGGEIVNLLKTGSAFYAPPAPRCRWRRRTCTTSTASCRAPPIWKAVRRARCLRRRPGADRRGRRQKGHRDRASAMTRRSSSRCR